MKMIPRRYLIAVMHFLGFIHLSSLRVNMSIAIVAMTSNRAITHSNETVFQDSEFEWSSKDQGMVLASFFYGYMTTQLIGGVLSPIVGAGRLFGYSCFLSAMLNIITPMMAYYGRLPLIIVRFLLGVVQGPLAPATSEFWSHWAPRKESTKLLGITFSGNHIGTFVVMGMCGIVADKLGWPWIFYIFAVSTMVWCTVWLYFISEDPREDKYISAEELKYITENQDSAERPNFSEAPWRQMLTSVPLWSAIMSQTVHNSTYYTMLTQLPTYLNDVSDLNLNSMGLLSCLPYLALALSLQVSGFLADMLRGRFNIETTKVRKIFISGSCIIQAMFLLATPHVTSIAQIIACITITVGIGGFQTFCANVMEVAPHYAGLTMGLSNTFGTLPGMISPIITGFVVQNKLASEWETVFYISAAVALMGAVLYSVFGSGERQPWATKHQEVFYDNPIAVVTADESRQPAAVNPSDVNCVDQVSV